MEIVAIITLYRKQNKHHSPSLMPTRMTVVEVTQMNISWSGDWSLGSLSGGE